LVVIDNDGAEAEVEKDITVLNVPPVAGFTYEAQPGGGESVADFTWSVNQEQHGSYPEGFSPTRPTDLDDIFFEDRSTSSGGVGGASFTARATDPDGEVVSYKWDFDGDGEIDAEGKTVEWTPPEAGTYHVTLIVTDDNGDSTVYEQDVDLEAGGGGQIVKWEWDFGDETTSDKQNPAHRYQDNDVYQVTLTVYDAAGNSDSITKEIEILNVPPVANFDWSFSIPEEFLPTCDDLIGGPPMPMSIGEGEGFGIACQEPEMPSNAGVVAFENLSVDSESWFDIAEWEWDFGGEGQCWESREGCAEVADPQYVFLNESGEFLFRGQRDVTLQVKDDDGATSSITQTITIANIPPYAIFYWQDDGPNWSEEEPTGPACTGGDADKTASDATISVERTITSWSGGNAVFGPDDGGDVAVTIKGSGTVNVTETIPTGWDYYYDPWSSDSNVTITDEGDHSWSATVDLGTGGSATISYELDAPFDDSIAPGVYAIQGDISYGEGGNLSLASSVVFCTTFNVDELVFFHAYGPQDSNTGFIDPNGDPVTYSWDFGDFGSATGQEPGNIEGPSGNDMEFNGTVTYQYDSELEEWVWLLPVSLTVTDDQGGSTTVTTTLKIPYGGGEVPE